ncbi:hypothetical protein [Photobacterium kishitanii]|uniref:hypothetical protein n=1 Tax=Photobacterium kishitanii TaxID=318456 RepID=UPI0027398DA4|nr:hypothetical protein [Photobacterium kishitanii]
MQKFARLDIVIDAKNSNNQRRKFFIEWTDITDIEYNIELTGRIRSERPPYIHSFHYDAKFAEHLRIASWYKLEIEQISALI